MDSSASVTSGSPVAPWLRYGLAALATIVGVVLRAAFTPLLGDRLPFIMVLLATLVTAWYGGLGPSILAMALGYTASFYFFVPPPGVMAAASLADLTSLLINLAVGLSIVLLVEAQRRRANASASAAAQHLQRLQREVGQRERFETQLRERETYFRALVEGAPLGILAVNTDGRIQIANSQIKDLFGYDREEVLGQPLEMLMPEGLRSVHIDHRGSFFEQPHTRPMAEDLSLSGLRKDGTEFPLEVALSYVRFNDQTLALAFISNALERKQREEALRESEERFRSMANSAPVMIWMAGTDAGRTFFNQSWLDFTGRTQADERDRGWLEDIHPDDVHHLQAYFDAFAAHEPFRLEYRLRRADGEYRWVMDTGVPRFTANRRFEGYIGSCIDIHERRRAEEHQKFLASTSDILAASLDYETTLNSVAELAVSSLADWCAIDLLVDGKIERVAVFHNDPEKLELAKRLQQSHPPSLDMTSGVGQVILTGEPSITWKVAPEMIDAIEDEEMRETIRGLGLVSVMIVPLEARGRVFGALTLICSESGRLFQQADLNVAQELARRAALAVDNAQLYRSMSDQREWLSVTLNSIGDAVIVTDTLGRVTFLNAVTEDLTGWQEQDALSQPVERIFSLLDETSGQEIDIPTRRVLNNQEPAGLDMPTLLVTRAGQRVPIDDSCAPIKDENGHLLGAVLVFRDVTTRREAEKQIEEALDRVLDLYSISRRINALSSPQEILGAVIQSRYLEGVSQASIGVFDHPWTDEEPAQSVQVIAHWSRQHVVSRVGEQYGVDQYGLAEFYSRDEPVIVRNVLTDPHLPESMIALLRSMDTASLILYPLVAAGEWHGMLAIHWPEPYSAGERITRHMQGLADQLSSAIYISRLLKSEAEARRRAEEADALKLKFLAMVSHELRTPLTSIQGFASTLLAEDVHWDADSQQDFIRIINEESDKLTDLISQLLDLSRLEAGMLSIDPHPENFDQVIDTVLPQLAVLSAGHDLVLDLPERLPTVNADGDRIGQVLSNLVGNAARYAPPGTAIRVAAQQVDDVLCVSVSDEGPGIPPDERENVFEAFRQANNHKDGKGQGAGLGLAIARGLVEAHGGRIWIEDRDGPGTTLTFALPVVRVAEK